MAVERDAVLQLLDMFAHQRDRRIDLAVQAMMDQIVVVIVPAGEAALVLEQIDHQAGIANDPNLFQCFEFISDFYSVAGMADLLLGRPGREAFGIVIAERTWHHFAGRIP